MNTIAKMKSQIIRRLLGRSYAESVAESKKPGKTGKATAFLLKKKPKGVRMKGVRQEAKPVIIAEKPKPRPRIVRPTVKKVDKAKIAAQSDAIDIKKAREEERKDKLIVAANSLFANLPTPSEAGLDPNHNYSGLLEIIGRVAFCSSLEEDILWTADMHFNPSVQVGAIKYKLDNKEDQKQFDSAVGKLVRWSGMGDSLNKYDDNPPTTLNILHEIGKEATRYEIRQAKLKPLDYYLDKIVEKGVKAELKTISSTSNRGEVLTSFTLAVAEVLVSLGFHKNRSKTAFFVNCSSNKFGRTEVSKKDIKPYFVEVIEGSKYYGKLSGANIPGKVMNGVLNHLPI